MGAGRVFGSKSTFSPLPLILFFGHRTFRKKEKGRPELLRLRLPGFELWTISAQSDRYDQLIWNDEA